MKSLLFLLIFISCSKVKNQGIPSSSKPVPSRSALSQDFNQYSSRIDTLVAFLWPKSFNTQDKKEALRNVIKISREIRGKKEAFLERRYSLRLEFIKNDCRCLLEGLCEGDETNENEEVCYDIEDQLYANDRVLPDIYKLVDEIKMNVLKTGGEWIETQQDFPEIPSSQFDFNELKIELSAFGSFDSAEGKTPLNYSVDGIQVLQQSFYQTLYFEMPRQKKGGLFTIEVAPTVGKASLLFQGEIIWIKEDQRREGIIYWEHERLDSL